MTNVNLIEEFVFSAAFSTFDQVEGWGQETNINYLCPSGMEEVDRQSQSHPLFYLSFEYSKMRNATKLKQPFFYSISVQDADGYINPIEMKAVLKLFLPLGEVSFDSNFNYILLFIRITEGR